MMPDEDMRPRAYAGEPQRPQTQQDVIRSKVVTLLRQSCIGELTTQVFADELISVVRAHINEQLIKHLDAGDK